MERLAVIDLGSNTFHLLIVETEGDGRFRTLYRQRDFTQLSQGGIDHILDERMAAGLSALKFFRQKLDEYGVKKVRAIGTAALRKADNRELFIDKASEILGIDVEVINGSMEAHYIYNGISMLQEFNTGTHLIMDIGGGSTEFILIRDGNKIWTASFILGVGVLQNMFHHDDPISPSELKALRGHITGVLADMMPVVATYLPETLAGASGSFEVLQSMTGDTISHDSVSMVTPDKFVEIADSIIAATEAERHVMPGMPAERVKLIVVGMVLKKAVFEMVRPSRILVSPYALKEGVLREMMGAELQ